MQQHWSDLVKPGRRVKVKVMDEVVDADIEQPYFKTVF